VHTALEPFSLPGGHVNFLGPEMARQVAESYGANPQLLLAVLAAIVPESVFADTPTRGLLTGHPDESCPHP
jgi:hypothetical protein